MHCLHGTPKSIVSHTNKKILGSPSSNYWVLNYTFALPITLKLMARLREWIDALRTTWDAWPLTWLLIGESGFFCRRAVQNQFPYWFAEYSIWGSLWLFTTTTIRRTPSWDYCSYYCSYCWRCYAKTTDGTAFEGQHPQERMKLYANKRIIRELSTHFQCYQRQKRT